MLGDDLRSMVKQYEERVKVSKREEKEKIVDEYFKNITKKILQLAERGKTHYNHIIKESEFAPYNTADIVETLCSKLRKEKIDVTLEVKEHRIEEPLYVSSWNNPWVTPKYVEPNVNIMFPYTNGRTYRIVREYTLKLSWS